MAEYIERETLLAAYDEAHKGPPGGARKLMVDALAADVAPVVHGRWVDYMVRDFHCSVCKEKLAGHGWEGYYINDLPNYCPNCGASMKDGE